MSEFWSAFKTATIDNKLWMTGMSFVTSAHLVDFVMDDSVAETLIFAGLNLIGLIVFSCMIWYAPAKFLYNIYSLFPKSVHNILGQPSIPLVCRHITSSKPIADGWTCIKIGDTPYTKLMDLVVNNTTGRFRIDSKMEDTERTLSDGTIIPWAEHFYYVYIENKNDAMMLKLTL